MPRGLQSIEGELRGDVLSGHIAAALSRTAAFEQVMGEKANLSANAICTDGLHRGVGGRREMGIRA